MQRFKAHETVLTFLCCALALPLVGCSAESSAERTEAIIDQSAMLAVGIPACPSNAVATVEVWRAQEQFAQGWDEVLQLPASGASSAPSFGADRFASLRLTRGEDGRYSGTASFVPQTSDEYAFFLESGSVPLSIRSEDSTEVVERCGRAVSAPVTAPAASPKVAFVAPSLRAGMTYALDLGPITTSLVSILALPQRVPGDSLRSEAVSACTSGAPDASLCALARATESVTARYLGSAEPPAIIENLAAGVHLLDYRGQAEGALSFHAGEAGEYRVYLGAPHVGVALYRVGQSAPLALRCGNLTAPSACSELRGLHSFVLDGPADLRLELTTPNNETTKWVRVLVTHEAQTVSEVPLEGLSAWLRSDEGITLDALARVTEWRDHGPAGNDAIPSTEARRPLREPSGPNGHPWVRFTGAHSLVFRQPLSLPSFSIFFVGQSQTTNQSASAAVLGSGVSQPESFLRWQATQHLSVKLASLNGTTIWAPTRRPHLSELTYGGTNVLEYVNGLAQGGFGGITGDAQFGEIGSVAGKSRLQGDLAEVIVYSRVLSSGEQRQVQRYLLQRYAL